MNRRIAGVVLASTVVLAPSSAFAAQPGVNYGKEYLAIVAPYNKLAAEAAVKASHLPSTPTASQFGKIVAPLVPAGEKVMNALAKVRWPSSAEADVKALVREIAVVDEDLRSVEKASSELSLYSAASQLDQDQSKMSGDVALVRGDLGLPATKP